VVSAKVRIVSQIFLEGRVKIICFEAETDTIKASLLLAAGVCLAAAIWCLLDCFASQENRARLA
jgi:hypothetical protein